MYQERIQKLQQQMQQDNIANQLISSPTSIRYFTSYDNLPGERFYLLNIPAIGQPILYLNRIFPKPNQTVTKLCQIVWVYDTENPFEKLKLHLTEGKTGIDKDWPSHFLLDLMAISPNLKPLNNSDIVDQLRSIKSNEEIKLMLQASKINDLAIEQLIKQVQYGYSEGDMVDKLRHIYYQLGGTGFSFKASIAYGPNAANPHHSSQYNRFPDYGDTVILDIGCFYNYYASDMTRTVFYGQPSDEALKVYDIVLKANLAAIEAVKPGVTFASIDKAARDIIEQSGYGKFFTHRTSHFIGQDTHESGDISATNQNITQIGHIFSIEPGIYLSGHLGIRIEDLVLVTENGYQLLNHYTKDPIIIEPNH